ncbi:MAG TPA: NAD-dependent epimerase/dehydratase family protein [Burkholderiaceae bacterium]|nr:NAD-dependent epimerase/dehydratase family protein [Burkholderiaceae bacterium]
MDTPPAAAIRDLLEAAFEDDVRAIVAQPLEWERLAGRRVVVTGAGGFLGGYLVRTLLALPRLGRVTRPVQVVALVRDEARARARFAALADTQALEFLAWDLGHIAVPPLGDVNYVLHAASQASPRYYGSDPVGTLLPNSVGTAALLRALQHARDPRGFLFVSSSEVYGTTASEVPLAEETPGNVDPASVRACYAESKRLGETMCVAWWHQHRLPAYIVRPFHTYGPGLLPDDGRVFADFAFNVARGENIVMTSDGNARRAFCHVSDAVAGFFHVLLKGAPGTPYNVANPDGELSVMDLAELLVGLFPERRLRVERRAPPQGGYLASSSHRLVPDVARLRALGWRPQVAPAAGFRRMIEAYA